MNEQEWAAEWLSAFSRALEANEAGAVSALFQEDCHWRDILALTWEIKTISGPAAVTAMLQAALPSAQLRGVGLAPGRTPPRRVTRAGVEVIEALFAFEAASGPGSGVVRLAPGGAAPLAWTIVTTLDALAAAPGGEQADPYAREFGVENWLDRRQKALRYEDREPDVLVIGAGQAGLSIAARLGQSGIDTLVVDRHQRVGDNWRRRYHALTLHNEVHVNHLPYMPFPSTWPVFIPKDKLANWFEAYAEAMELNVWTGTDLAAGEYDETAGCWSVVLRRDGQERTMRPRHLVFATGVSSIPVMPSLPGLNTFRGAVMHSGAYTHGADWAGQPALVLGTGNSGHDVAQDLHASGADVTIIQRSPTYIVSLKEAQSVYAIYKEGPTTEDCDLLATATPYPLLVKAYQLSTAASRRADQPLLDGLAARGFQLDFGEDETGFQMKYLRRGGGYYFNIGCADLIADGSIKLLQYSAIERFVEDGVRLADGRLVPARLLVLATGYKNQQDVVRSILGNAVADRIGPVWGFDEGGELRNMWRPTKQPGLWFTAGSLAQCRIYSKYLALQIARSLL